MCTGRVDLSFIFRAFARGADGVLIGGCWPGECHYVTEGNYDALANMHLCKKLMSHIGMSPDRLRLEWVAASEGARFAEVMNDFVKTQRELGPLGEGDGLTEDVVHGRIEALQKLIPYIKLVERERLRPPVKSEQAYNEFYQSDETNQLFNELIADKLAVSQILQALSSGPLSTAELSESLALDSSRVSKLMNTSSRQGLVAYDVEQKRYALAEVAG